MSPTTITFLVLAATVAVFVWDRIPVGIVAAARLLSRSLGMDVFASNPVL